MAQSIPVHTEDGIKGFDRLTLQSLLSRYNFCSTPVQIYLEILKRTDEVRGT